MMANRNCGVDATEGGVEYETRNVGLKSKKSSEKLRNQKSVSPG